MTLDRILFYAAGAAVYCTGFMSCFCLSKSKFQALPYEERMKKFWTYFATYLASIFPSIIGVICCFIGLSEYDADYASRSLGLSVLGFLLAISSVLLSVYNLKKASAAQKKAQREAAQKQAETKLDRFFVECVLAEASDFSNPKDKQRAQLFAEKYAVEYPDGIEALYQQGLNGHKAISQRIEHDWLEGKRAEERKESERLNKYSDLTGRDKRIAMLSDKASQLGCEAAAYTNLANLEISRGQQKEKDWAIRGGAATAIAGPIAGIAVAANTQMQNAQIREENEKNRQANLLRYNNQMRAAENMRMSQYYTMDEIKSVPIKLISEASAVELMKKISFSNTSVSVSETGAAVVCASASVEPGFMIYDNVPAVVDGTILAQIYDGSQLCGTAKLVLPIYGLGQDVSLKGICLDGCKYGKEYTIEFTAENLWAMER